MPTFFPIDCKCKAKNSTVGVLPTPPVVIFPMLMTLHGNLLVFKIFVKIVKILRQPSSLVGITPDGPKGPERIPKPGVIKAAQKTGALIIPVSAISTKHWQFINWHTFFLEKPFGKIFLQYGEPLQLDPEHDFETCKKLLSDAMDLSLIHI